MRICPENAGNPAAAKQLLISIKSLLGQGRFTVVTVEDRNDASKRISHVR